MLLKTRLIVLGTTKQGEGNLVVRCFTRKKNQALTDFTARFVCLMLVSSQEAAKV